MVGAEAESLSQRPGGASQETQEQTLAPNAGHRVHSLTYEELPLRHEQPEIGPATADLLRNALPNTSKLYIILSPQATRLASFPSTALPWAANLTWAEALRNQSPGARHRQQPVRKRARKARVVRRLRTTQCAHRKGLRAGAQQSTRRHGDKSGPYALAKTFKGILRSAFWAGAREQRTPA